MPALPVIANVFRCAINWDDGASARAVNVMHFLSVTLTPAQIATALGAHIQANQLGTMVGQAEARTVDITPLDGTTATQRFALANWSGPLATGDYSPASAVLVKLTTALRGRSNRGRIFLPFPSESKISNGIVDATTVGNMTTAWLAFDNAMATAGATLQVTSYKHANTHALTNISVENVLATQRRRQSRLRG